MALAHPLFVGFSSASRLAREGGDLEVTVETEEGPRTFLLPWFFVRQVDALLERWRREEHEAILLTMNDGWLGATLGDAAGAGGLRDVTFLLARGAGVGDGGMPYASPLVYAAAEGHVAVMTLLLDAGAEELKEALHISAMYGHTPAAALLLDRGVDVDADDFGALSTAAYHGFLEFVRLLLDRGADVNGASGEPLWNAQRQGHAAVADLLMERGALLTLASDSEEEYDDDEY